MKGIKIITDNIKLGQFLKLSGIIVNGSEAKMFLEDNIVLVNGEEENRRGRKIYPGDVVVVQNKEYKVIVWFYEIYY